tara:strand:- start:1179 stop:1307 length:129 start_codon:yes stop_codon:yes gene_type:complete
MWEIFNLPTTIFIVVFNLLAWSGLAYGIFAAGKHLINKYELF